MIFEGGASYKYPVAGAFQNSEYGDAVNFCEDVETTITKRQDQPNTADPNETVITISDGGSGTYCSDGKRVGDVEMSEEDMRAACGSEAPAPAPAP